MIEWTGERCVPWAPDIQVVYEHYHRYLWAASIVTGRRVLDLASGEGFGAALLAATSTSVVGIDVDEQAVAHSTLNYADGQVEFRVADAQDLSVFPNRSFGAVIAFEMIEHIDDQVRVLDEIARVLEPDGLLVISTPERRAYSEGAGQRNPDHVKELSCEELDSLLVERFKHNRIWGQRAITGSALSELGDPATEASRSASPTFFVARDGEEWSRVVGLSPLYLVAVASNTELPEIPEESVLGDCGLQLMRRAEAAADARSQERLLASQERVLASEARLRWAEHEHARLRQVAADRDVELGLRRGRLDELASEIAQNKVTIDRLQHDVAVTRQALWRIGRAVSWRLYETLHGQVYHALGGEGAPAVRVVQRLIELRSAAKRKDRHPPASEAPGRVPGGAIDLPKFADPTVSIIIPVHSRADLTWGCLASIRDNTELVSYEVIIVADDVDAPTDNLLRTVSGAQILVTERNLGFLRSVNRGAEAASGKWLVLCNNDIEVCNGWLSAMLDCAQSVPDVGVVTPKFVFPSGLLNEAGGIVWKDGRAWNYGRGNDPDQCGYNFRREVDYGSAAALLVNAALWRNVGGFDDRFAPIYYEDTDLCFQAREAGMRVMYEPGARIVHHEGATSGTNLLSGLKRYQELNRVKFVEKWSSELHGGQRRRDPRDPRSASNRHSGPHILIVDHRVPFWDRDSGGLRMRGMIETFLALGCRVTFLPDNLFSASPYTEALQRKGVEVWYGTVDVAAELAAVGSGLALVLMCRPDPTSHWIELVRRHAPEAPVVYDTVDLHWLREARRIAFATKSDQPVLGPTALTLREMELSLIRAVDATVAVTDEERALIEADVPGALVHVVPNVHEIRSDVPPADERWGVVFVGGFEHPPNQEAAIRLVRGVMPLVWQEIGDVPVTVVGGSAPRAVEDLASAAVEVAGWVPVLEPILDHARVMVAPLSFGAGIKGKVTQALAAGLPVVTTPIGSEGLAAIDGENMLIGVDDGELAERVIRLLQDSALWDQVAAAGRALASEACSRSVMLERIGGLLDQFGVRAMPARLASGALKP